MGRPSSLALQDVELYVFAGAGQRFLLTPHEFDVDLGGERFESLPLQRNALALGSEAAKTALELRLPPDAALVRHLLASAVSGAPTSATLHIARRSPDGEHWWPSGTRWMGRVLGVEVADDAARVRCESAQASLKRIGLRRLYSRKCSHVLYSAACGAAPVTATAVVRRVRGRTIDLQDPPAGPPGSVQTEPASAWEGGWLQTQAGSRHMIVRAFDVSLELLAPAPLVAGTAVTLVAGCDHGTATCDRRFHNLDNYGGFPALPGTNPFATGVF